MKPLCVIGARGGSKEIPKKNIRLFAGKPLIAYTIESALKSNIFSDVVISTEDKTIAKISKNYGAKVPFVRPKKLATDKASMTDVLLHAVNQINSLGFEFDVLVNLDCTVPLLQKSDIKGGINLLKQKKCDSVCLVYNQHHNPYYNMFETNSKGFLKLSKKIKSKINTRQKAPTVYQAVGIYVLDLVKFMKYKKLFMPKTLPYEIPPEHGIMIDTELEFQIVECIAKKIIKI